MELNRYGYVANNPINAMDPSGMMADYAMAHRPALTAGAAKLVELAVYVTATIVVVSIAILIAQGIVDVPSFSPPIDGSIDWGGLIKKVGQQVLNGAKVATTILIILSILVNSNVTQDTAEGRETPMQKKYILHLESPAVKTTCINFGRT